MTRTNKQSILFGRGTGAVFEKINQGYTPKNYDLRVMDIPMSEKQYSSVLTYVKSEYGKNWNGISKEERKLMIKNHIQMNFPKNEWGFEK